MVVLGFDTTEFLLYPACQGHHSPLSREMQLLPEQMNENTVFDLHFFKSFLRNINNSFVSDFSSITSKFMSLWSISNALYSYVFLKIQHHPKNYHHSEQNQLHWLFRH